MAQETEIKLRIENKKALGRALKRLGAKPVGGGDGRVHEWNVIYDTPQGGLAKHGQLLRIRTETPLRGRKKNGGSKPRVVLTFKQPAVRPEESLGATGTFVPIGRHKVREEIETEVSDAATLGRIFEGLGMKGWFRYEKYRTTMVCPASTRWAKGLLIELDETPVGTFVELEGPAEAIDRAAEALGFSRKDYILKNYLSIYLEDCRKRGLTPQDMVFNRSGKNS
jgi:adenylate cyclase class 2